MRAAITNWCTTTLNIPRAMTKMMDVAQRLTGKSRNAEYDRACPVPLESTVRLSVLAGYEIVLTTESIREVSNLPPETFTLPLGYREVPPPRVG